MLGVTTAGGDSEPRSNDNRDVAHPATVRLLITPGRAGNVILLRAIDPSSLRTTDGFSAPCMLTHRLRLRRARAQRATPPPTDRLVSNFPKPLITHHTRRLG